MLLIEIKSSTFVGNLAFSDLGHKFLGITLKIINIFTHKENLCW